MRSRLKKLLYALLLLALLLGSALPAAVSQASPLPEGVGANSLPQAGDADQKARLLLSKMTPEERVGQLLMVSFQGGTADDKTQIYDLINRYHIGGVVLVRKNNNFTDAADNVSAVYELIANLQNDAWTASQASTAKAASQYVPLIVGIPQEGDLYPNDQILSGVTSLPSLMSIGATWDTLLSERVGSAMGSELADLGFNLYLGPSLDVLDILYTFSSEDLGTRTFGGDPYWVSELGKAYISGLHKGSDNQLAVIAAHFPGAGSSDRPPDTEIATVRKSLDQLKEKELVPFFSVTGDATSPEETADGLLLSHIRYQFQGNIRATTNPVSFDRKALDDILKFPQFTPWRSQGGLMVSDNLGSQAVRKFFDPSGNNFDARQVASNALLTGNDLLYLDDFLASGDPDQATTIVRTLAFFAQKYREDPNFAQRVDQSVERVLALKYRIYPEFNIDKVIPDPELQKNVGASQQVSFDVASQAVTLISPDSSDLVNVLPARGPEPRERILFIADTKPARQCSTCAEKSAVSVDAMQSAVLKLYGPSAAGRVSPSLLASYSYQDLWMFLNQQQTTTSIETDMNLADWVVFVALKPEVDRPESMALRKLLADRPDLLRNKRVIVFAMDAPYYLDATEISKITAYYGLYSKSSKFLEAAAAVLFQELSPTGALPVTVPGVGYNLVDATRPDPAQVIDLGLDQPDVGLTQTQTQTTGTPEATSAPAFRNGDTIPLRTGIILDHNRNPVPDGTVVTFLFRTGGDTGLAQTTDVTTVKGVARATYRIDRPGLLEIQVQSDLAQNSTRLRLNITGNEPAAVITIVPTSNPTMTPSPTNTPTPTSTATITPTPAPAPKTGVVDWVLGLAVSLGGGALGLWMGTRLSQARWGVRWGLCVLIGGLLAYNYLALNLPGTQDVLKTGVTAGTVLVTLIGAGLGAASGWVWRWLAKRQKPEEPAAKT